MTIRKKILFWAVLSGIVFLIVEIFGLLTFSVFVGSLYSKSKIKHEIKSLIQSPQQKLDISFNSGELWWGDQVEVLHPYFGYSCDPLRNAGISANGFPSLKKNQVLKRSPNKIRVALLGGSFAREIYYFQRKELASFFVEPGKEVEILNFAIGGYKQPQQLLVLSYLFAIGAEFDYVVNIDGFNEVALPYLENIKHNVNPFFPRMWINRAKNRYDQVEIRLMGKIETLKDLKRSWAVIFYTYKLYRSPSLSLIWKMGNVYLDNKIVADNLELHSKIKNVESFTVNGPEYHYSTDKQLYGDLTDLWFQSSLAIKALCDSKHIVYYHFLQPNQYVPNSKPILTEEKKRAYDKNSPFIDGVVNGYPLLCAKGKELLENGVNFNDLTWIFKNNSSSLYKDTCCHLNNQGYTLFMDKVGKFISETSNARMSTNTD